MKLPGVNLQLADLHAISQSRHSAPHQATNIISNIHVASKAETQAAAAEWWPRNLRKV